MRMTLLTEAMGRAPRETEYALAGTQPDSLPHPAGCALSAAGTPHAWERKKEVALNPDSPMSAVPPTVSCGVPELDRVLGGGITANRFYMIEGIPGSGK